MRERDSLIGGGSGGGRGGGSGGPLMARDLQKINRYACGEHYLERMKSLILNFWDSRSDSVKYIFIDYKV